MRGDKSLSLPDALVTDEGLYRQCRQFIVQWYEKHPLDKEVQGVFFKKARLRGLEPFELVVPTIPATLLAIGKIQRHASTTISRWPRRSSPLHGNLS